MTYDSPASQLLLYYEPPPVLSNAKRLPRSRLRCVLSMFSSLRVKVPAQPDGGEGLEICKGYRREAGSERSMDQMCESMDKNRIQGASVGRAGNLPQSPYPSRMRNVDSATVHGRQPELTSGDLLCVASATEMAERRSDHRAEVSRGHSRS